MFVLSLTELAPRLVPDNIAPLEEVKVEPNHPELQEVKVEPSAPSMESRVNIPEWTDHADMEEDK